MPLAFICYKKQIIFIVVGGCRDIRAHTRAFVFYFHFSRSISHAVDFQLARCSSSGGGFTDTSPPPVPTTAWNHLQQLLFSSVQLWRDYTDFFRLM